MTVSACTISGNSSTGAGVGGGGIENVDTAQLLNTIVAGNTAPTRPDVAGAFASQGHNLIGKTDGSSGWGMNDLTGSVAHPRDPHLGPL